MQKSIAAAFVSGPTEESPGINVFEYRFDAADPTFAGHFPGRPILPGVFQLEIVHLAAEAVTGSGLSVLEVAKSKFQRPISPGELLRLDLKITEESDKLRAKASFTVGGQPAGEAILVLARSR